MTYDEMREALVRIERERESVSGWATRYVTGALAMVLEALIAKVEQIEKEKK